MILDDEKRTLESCREKLGELRRYLDLDHAAARVAEIEREMEAHDFWDDSARAQVRLKEKTRLSESLVRWNALEKALGDISAAVELAVEADDESFLPEIQRGLRDLGDKLVPLERAALMRGEHDESNAIVTIHPGAGGTESQDWAQMLLRMYLRWAERQGFKTEVMDLQPGDEAGIKSATFTASGPFAYGYLKAEVGVHRLVRISPFDANKRRHTSFASVFVYPELDENIAVDVNEADLRVDTFRASGAGGQHVNKTSSAVRITHIPTGIVVTCQNERSQIKNRAFAMKVLKARLYELKQREQEEKLAVLEKEKKDIAWGSQIRSYVLQPYQLVKDLRTGTEIGNVTAVLDGDIQPLIEAYLAASARPTSPAA
ncbi:MAG: peptide chain release factor 2 [Nitrospirae bacterium]|nr:peptide chain release factor 2 [Nitrospirota bacterium]